MQVPWAIFIHHLQKSHPPGGVQGRWLLIGSNDQNSMGLHGSVGVSSVRAIGLRILTEVARQK
jgi:hypothetical protein